MGLRKASKRFHSHAGASGRPSCSACRHSARQTLNHDVRVWAFLASKILALVVLRFQSTQKHLALLARRSQNEQHCVLPDLHGKKSGKKRTMECLPLIQDHYHNEHVGEYSGRFVAWVASE